MSAVRMLVYCDETFIHFEFEIALWTCERRLHMRSLNILEF